MIRSRQISSQALGAFSRSMARMLEAGVDVRKSLQTSSQQSAASIGRYVYQARYKSLLTKKKLLQSVEMVCTQGTVKIHYRYSCDHSPFILDY